MANQSVSRSTQFLQMKSLKAVVFGGTSARLVHGVFCLILIHLAVNNLVH